MKYFVHTIVAILLFTSCGTNTAKSSGMEADSVGGDYTANAAAIEEKKQEMLSVADVVWQFRFPDDKEFQSQDPHAYWLMNRMIQMDKLIETANDDWAWILAMNESVEEYNHRLGRKIGSVDAACNAIDELLDIYNARDQSEINTVSYALSVFMHYKLTYAYYRFIEFIDDYKDDSDWDVSLRALYYREFKEWFDIYNAAKGIMRSYTYAPAHYSALPMDLNCIYERWSRERLAELEIERDIIYWSIYSSFDWKPFESDAKIISPKRFDKLLGYFKTRTYETVVEEMFPGEKDYDYARKYIDERFDFDNYAEMLRYYETALVNWREVRGQIALMLPKEKQKSYREITKQMHTRLYNDLAELKKITY